MFLSLICPLDCIINKDFSLSNSDVQFLHTYQGSKWMQDIVFWSHIYEA